MEWLDDTIINAYGKVLQNQFPEHIFVFDSHFIEKLQSSGFEVVKRWDKNTNIFERQFIFYPMFENMYWFLAI